MYFRNLINRGLDSIGAGLTWLALHYECWRIGHTWNLAPNSAWCEHCEARLGGSLARALYEAKYGPYVPQPLARFGEIHVVPWCPPDQIIFFDASKFKRIPDEGIIDASGQRIFPNAPLEPLIFDKIFD